MSRKRELGSDIPLVLFDPRNANQNIALEVFEKNDLMFLLGPAGTGKTHTAVYMALNEFTKVKGRRKANKIVITRPVVEAGEYLGALPGDIGAKVNPYMLPIYDCVSKMIHGSNKFIEDNFDISPLAYMRGRTFENCVAILDEAQNCNVGQLLLFMTRLGVGCKMIISGDMDQADIPRTGLRPWVESLTGKDGIGFVRFTEEDIVRHPLVRTILACKPTAK